MNSFRAVICVAFFAAFFISADAQATRTWISGVGDDVNPCSRTAPCKTFAGAISKTATGGEINCLDPGGFGAVTITKSITLDCRQTTGSILASLTNGISINGAGINVRIRGLSINGSSNGLNGIRIVSAARVTIEDTVIDGFTQSAISVNSSEGISVGIRNASIRNNVQFGLSATPASTADITVVDSFFTGNGTAISAGAGATIRISDNTIAYNTTGLSVLARGAIISYGNNANGGNTTNGSPSSTVTLQ
jgi:hypothetical protein